MSTFANMTPAMIDAHNARVARRRAEYGKSPEVCDHCEGQGHCPSEGSNLTTCLYCGGSGRLRPIPAPEAEKQGEDRESKVRAEILAFCDRKWPKWVPMYSRTDVPSTLNIGAQDLTIFGPFPLCILVDTKSKSGKPSPAQRIWECRLNALGWQVHWIRTMQQFLIAAEGGPTIPISL